MDCSKLSCSQESQARELVVIENQDLLSLVPIVMGISVVARLIGVVKAMRLDDLVHQFPRYFAGFQTTVPVMIFQKMFGGRPVRHRNKILAHRSTAPAIDLG